MTVMAGTQKISMGRDRRQDKIDAMNAMRNAEQNAYVTGVQESMNGGVGDAVKGDRGPIGNSNIAVNELIQGKGTFAYSDSPGNQPTPMNQTGSVELQVSNTNIPQEDPEEMQTDALSNRLAMMAKGGQGFPGLNNRNRSV